MHVSNDRHSFSVFVVAAVVMLTIVFTACGGGNSSSNATPQPSPSALTTPVQVGIGDSPADWIMAFGMNINSIAMTNNNGGTVNLLSSPTPMEMMQLMGTTRPITMLNVPQGTYTQATINFSSVSMGYMDPGTHQYVQKTMAGPFVGTVSFNPALVIGSTPSVLSFDMNMGASVNINNGSVTITPTFTERMGPISATGQNPWQGWMQHMVGSLSSISGSKFTMNMLMGLQSVTFATNGSTQFDGLSGMGMMSNGMIVSVDAITQADGSLLAQHVQSMWANSGGMMGGGIVTGITAILLGQRDVAGHGRYSNPKVGQM